MENKSLISIIIPFHNSERHLRRCVDTIIQQTYTNLEIILVDDGSQDGSKKVAQKLVSEDKRIVLLEIPHSGVSVARNKGLETAKGSYIMFVDSDDIMNINVIRRMMLLMKKTYADMVTCGIERTEALDQQPLKKKISFKTYTKEEYLRLFFKINSNEWVHYPVAKLYKKELLPVSLYPPGIRVGEDVIGTYLAISRAEKIVALSDTGYYYYINPESATSDFSEKDFDLIKVWDQMTEITKGTEPDNKYAVLGRNRINFTLLLRMITQVPAKEITVRYSKQQKRLLRDLRRCEDDLLRSPVILSRKLMIFMLCHMYGPTALGCDIFVRLKNMKGLI